MHKSALLHYSYIGAANWCAGDSLANWPLSHLEWQQGNSKKIKSSRIQLMYLSYWSTLAAGEWGGDGVEPTISMR